MSRAVRLTKRFLDVVGALLGLLGAAPLLGLVAAALWLEGGGPILGRTTRAGRVMAGAGPGRFGSFTMLRFRSAGVGEGGWLTRFLRRSRVDRLPQLANVLRGEMSLVGPRPETPDRMESIAAAFPGLSRQTGHMKPGLTGLAQIAAAIAGRPLPPLTRAWSNPARAFRAEALSRLLVADDLRLKVFYDLAYATAIERFGGFLRCELVILGKTPLALVRQALASPRA